MSEIDHPKHYNQGKIEAIEVIEDWQLGFHLGNTIKYISRAGKKDPNRTKEDLLKAKWYLERYLEAVGHEQKQDTQRSRASKGRKSSTKKTSKKPTEAA